MTDQLPTPAELAELEEYIAEMKDAPWHRAGRCILDSDNMPICGTNSDDELGPDNATGIVALRNLAPKLIAAAREVERLRAFLKRIQGWDCLNPPQAQLCADLPWLKTVVDNALNGGPMQ